MSYTINPNAKNKWARNAENTMDLSLETDASSVYLDNGRTLEQEIGEGSMVSNVATVDTSMSKVIDGTLDGAYESLMFKGKSLVNIIDYNKRSFNEGNTLNSGVVTINHQGGSYSNTFFLTPDNIKPSTDYFVIFNVISNTYENHVKLMSDDDKACCFDCGLTIQAKTTGLHKMKVTSKSNLSSCRYLLRTFGYNNTNNGSCQYRVMVIEYIEGMENWDIPFFEGLCDVKMPILRNVGKNLFDKTKITKNYEFYNDKIVETKGWFVSDYIPVRPNTDYKLIKTIRIHIFDENKNLIKYPKPTDGIFTTPTNASFIRINGQLTELDIWQVEEGSTTTSYEPYKTNILRTSEEIVLRSLPNGVCDTLNLNTGEYVQRIGEVIKDNATGFGLAGGGWENKSDVCTFERFKPKGMKVQVAHDKPTLNCDKVPSNTFSTQWNNSKGIESITQHGWGGIVLSITRDKLLIQDVDGLNTYLQSNPLTIQYELAEPITTIVEPLTIPFAYQNGHIILESGYEGQSLLPTLEYSTVVNRTGQVESVAKVIQKQEKQLTMLEQMLIQNIINLDYNNTLLTLKNEMEEML